MSEPLVSVNMLAYNHAPFIAQAIESVLGQETDFPIELVIGEDWSSDGTREFVLECQNKRPDVIRVVTSECNVGMRQNTLRTLKACRGKYLAFCEGDDYWNDKLKLRKQVQFMESHPSASLVAHRANRVDVDGNTLLVFPSEQPAILNPRDVIIRGGGFFATNSMMVRSEVFSNTPAWFSAFPVGDAAMVNLAINRGDVGFLNDIMSSYRTGTPGSWSERVSEGIAFPLRQHYGCVKAYRAVMREEKRYRRYYREGIRHLYWCITRIVLSRFVKRPLRSLFRG